MATAALNIARIVLAAVLMVAAALAHAAPPQLTPEERAWLATAPPVTVGVQSDSAPYSLVDASGRPTGYSNEMFRLAAAHVGLRYRFDEGRPWDVLWARARERRVDVLTFLWKTPEREAFVRFVEPPYIAHTLSFWVRADDPQPPTMRSTRGRVFALGRDFAINPVLRSRFPDAAFVEVDSVADALQRVSRGEADAYVDDRGTLNYVSAQLGITNIREGVAFEGKRASSHMAVQRDAVLLQSILAKGLAAVTPRERRHLAAQWLDPRISTARRLAPYIARALPLVPFVLGALLWLVYSHRRLSREVRLRRAFESEAHARATELAAREAFQRELLDAAQAAVLVMDHAGRWVIFNRFAESLLGWTAADVLGRTVRELPPSEGDTDAAPHLLHPGQVARAIALLGDRLGESVPPDWRAIYRYAELGLPPQRVDMVHRDGRRIPVLLSLACVHGPQEEDSGVIIVANDLGEQVRLEEDLRASEERERDANRAKSSFLAAMSHEIRTPMIGITGTVEILAHTRLDAEQRKALEIMQSSTDALLGVLGDILDFSKIEADRIELQPVAADLVALVESTVASFAGAASSKGLTLSCDAGDGIAPAYRFDPLRFRQVLSNLLANAIKFTVDGGVRVTVQRVDGDGRDVDLIDLRVTDTGPGVSPEQRERLFQPFMQGESQAAGRHAGSGLGLAICRRLAELMGGSVELLASGADGSTFQLRLPLPRAQAVEAKGASSGSVGAFAARPAPAVAEAEANGSLVLLVDDHPTNRLVIAHQLALAGYASESAADGEEGLARWASGRYALVLTDIHMPGIDGYEMTRRLRAAEAERGLPRTPVVALTASALRGEMERCHAAGMDDYLAKPAGVATLASTLARWLPHTAAATAGVSAVDTARGTESGAGTGPAVLDPTVLQRVTGGDAAGARAVLDDFMRCLAQDLDELDGCIAAGDVDGVVRQAHRIDGAARSVGAFELSAAAAELETLARGPSTPAASARLRTVLEPAVARLRSRLDPRDGGGSG